MHMVKMSMELEDVKHSELNIFILIQKTSSSIIFISPPPPLLLSGDGS